MLAFSSLPPPFLQCCGLIRGAYASDGRGFWVPWDLLGVQWILSWVMKIPSTPSRIVSRQEKST
eukprot:8647388-Karenia_brevis.AAC.1